MTRDNESPGASNQEAWDLASRKYEGDLESDITFLTQGGIALQEHECQALREPCKGRRVIHLQCSHGLDALSILNLGAAEVVGIDISPAMISLAERKGESYGARARWVQSDVLAVPDDWAEWADLVYTGKGALPWIADIRRWADTVARLLRKNGRLYLYEGHPLNWIWDPRASTHRLREDHSGYFTGRVRPNDDFPASAVERYTARGLVPPEATEFQWTLGEVVSALCGARLRILEMREYPMHFWPQFGLIPDEEMGRIPHSYSITAEK